RYSLGAKGDFGAFGSSWAWDAHISYGRHEGTTAANNGHKPANYALAVDAVRDPATGKIVCRSSLTDPSNGCVPYNLFGSGVNSVAAINYMKGGQPFYNESYKQWVEAFNVSGEPFSLWAGPV